MEYIWKHLSGVSFRLAIIKLMQHLVSNNTCLITAAGEELVVILASH